MKVVFLIIAAVSIIFYITKLFSHPWLSLIAVIIFATSLTIGLELNQPVNPTKQDVLDGKAYYQETQVITDNDTIKIYDIIWKKENF